jgi:hypothetical protein
MDSTAKAWWRTDGARIALFGCVAFLFLFQAPLAFRVNVRNWFADDGCYLQHLGDYIGIGGDNICRKEDNYFAQGAPMVWIAPALVGKSLAHLFHENVTQWILPMIAFTSFAMWVLSIYFVVGTLRRSAGTLGAGAGALVLAVLICLNVPSLYYSSSRVFMAHASEAMLALGLVYFLVTDRFLPALLFLVLMIATRYNDAPAIFLFLGRLIDRGGGLSAVAGYLRRQRRATLAAFSVALALLAGFCVWVAFFVGYAGVTAMDLLNWVDWKYAITFVFSPGWGVLWTGTWWLAALVAGVLTVRRLSWAGRGALVWVLSQAAICLAWGGTGSDFAYRYLIGSYAAALVIWLDVLRAYPRIAVAFRALTAVGAVWMLAMTMFYSLSPTMTSTWQPDGTCFIPPDMALKIWNSLLDFSLYRWIAARQLAPMVLYVSAHPSAQPTGTTFTPLNPMQARIYGAAVAACLAYCLTYGVSLLRERRRAP